MGLCKRCNRIFQHANPAVKLCPVCMEKEDKDFQIIYNYVASKGTPTIMDTILATGVSRKTILRFIDDGRVSLVENNELHLGE